MRNPDKLKYRGQKANAKCRGIDWQLTFDEWMDWWLETGHYHERGPWHGQYVMARIGDIGPYALDNIICIKNSENNILAFGPKQEQTHCIRGHPLSGSNVWIRRDGSRECKKCKYERHRLRRMGLSSRIR